MQVVEYQFVKGSRFLKSLTVDGRITTTKDQNLGQLFVKERAIAVNKIVKPQGFTHKRFK